MQSTKEENSFRICFGKGCNNAAIHYITVVFIKKSGWFCNDCARFLKLNDLVYACEQSTLETIRDNGIKLKGNNKEAVAIDK
jgi:hypothetical protein